MSILLTASTGFVASHFLQRADVFGLSKPSTPRVDITDYEELYASIKNHSFNHVVHIAAQSSVQQSFENPSKTFHSNVLGTLNLLRALKEVGFTGRFIYVSSAECYGDKSIIPIQECEQLLPLSPYAASKCAAEALTLEFSKDAKFDIMVARPFNHIGIFQKEGFAIPSFVKQLLEIKSGIKEAVMSVGNLEVIRDFLDVDDVIDAYLAILKHGKRGQVYNIASEIPRTMGSMLHLLLEIVNIEVDLFIDEKLIRKNQPLKLVGSKKKIEEETFWTPKIKIEDSLRKIYTYLEERMLCTSEP